MNARRGLEIDWTSLEVGRPGQGKPALLLACCMAGWLTRLGVAARAARLLQQQRHPFVLQGDKLKASPVGKLLARGAGARPI